MLVMFVGLLIGILGILISFLRREIDLGTFIIVFVPIILLIVRPLVVFSLGSLLVTFGQPNIAETLYSLMIGIAPKFGFAYFQRGILRQNREDMNEALSDYEIALNIAKAKTTLAKPPLWSVNYSAALIRSLKVDIYLFKQDEQQAIIECNNGLELNENDQSITLFLKYQRGYAQLVIGNYEDALLDFNCIYFNGELTARERPFETELYALKALAYYKLEDFDEANMLWEKAVKLDHNYTNQDWLHDTCRWPEGLIQTAGSIRTDVNNTTS